MTYKPLNLTPDQRRELLLERIDIALKQSGHAPYRMATKIGTTSQSIHYWRTGKHFPTENTFKIVMARLDKYYSTV